MPINTPTAMATTPPPGPLDQTYPMGQPRPLGQYPPRRTLPADVAATLWRARALFGLTNNELARLMKVDASYFSKLVRGTRCPSSVTVERLIAVLPLTPLGVEALRAVAVQDAGESLLPG